MTGRDSSESSVPSAVSFSGIWTFGRHANILPDAIAEYLKRGLHNSSLTVRDPKSEGTVHLRKYFAVEGGYGIDLLFSIESDAHGPIAVLETYLENLATRLNACEKQISGPQTNFRIDTGRDVLTTAGIVTYIFRDVLRRPDNSKFQIHAKNVSPWQEVIETPDQKSAEFVDGTERNDIGWGKRDGYGGLSNAVYACLSLFQILGMIGLLATLVFQRPGWSGISLSLGAIHMSIPWLGLISVFLFSIGFLSVFTEAFWVTPTNDRQIRYVREPKTLKNGFLLFFGGPLGWVYLGLWIFAFYGWTSL